MSQRVRLPLIGPSSKASSGAQQSAVTINMIPEVNDADAKAVVALHSAPGFFRVADWSEQIAGTPQIRGFHKMGERFFAVIAEKICEVTFSPTLTAFSTLIEFGSLSTFSGRVGMSDNGGKLVIGDGTPFLVLDLDTHTLTPVLDEDTDPIRGTFSRWIDGYTLYFQRDSGKYHYSELNDPTTVRGLNYLSAEGNPDNIEAAIVANREVIIVGSASTEWHANAGGADNAFERISGGYIEHGTAARWSVCAFDNTVVMVGKNAEGAGVVWRLGGAGAAFSRISTHAVEKCIAKVLFSSLDRRDLTEQITAFAYQDAGHSYYVLNLPAVLATVNSPAQRSMTWVYDAATQLWHERAYRNPDTGQFERILSDHHVLWKGRHYTGAYNLAHVYEMSLNYFRENTLELVKLRESAGPLNFGGKRFSLHKIGIEGEVGVGRDADVQGSHPQIMLQVSWDGGFTWSNEVWRSWGKIGERNCRAEWGPMGSGYDLVVRVSCSEPIRFVLTGGWADVTVGR